MVYSKEYTIKPNRPYLLTVTIIHLTWWVLLPLDKTQKWFLFFGTINSLCNFFSHSTQRWRKLKDAVPLVLKAEAETRSPRREAVKPIELYLKKIVLLLENMVEDDSQTIDT